MLLTLKVSITNAAGNILIFFFFFFFFFFLIFDLILFFDVSEKIRLDISYELPAKQTIHIKCQVLFSVKNKNKLSQLLHFKGQSLDCQI